MGFKYRRGIGEQHLFNPRMTEGKEMYQVLFYSKGGHTRMIADAIASELGVKAGEIKNATIDRAAKVVFLGSGCYGGKPGEDMTKFIEAQDFSGREIALFSTSAGAGGKELDDMAGSLRQKGANVVGRFTCKGQFIFFVSRGHPDKADVENAKQFARQTAKTG